MTAPAISLLIGILIGCSCSVGFFNRDTFCRCFEDHRKKPDQDLSDGSPMQPPPAQGMNENYGQPGTSREIEPVKVDVENPDRAIVKQ